MTVTVTAIHTNDAQPNVDPYKISRKAGYSKADVTLTLNPIPGIVPRDGLVPGDTLMPGAQRYYALVVNNAERHGAVYGMAPSIQRGLVCGIGNRCGPGKWALNVLNAVVVDDVTVAELAAMGDDTEGLHNQFIWYLTDEGWNT